MRDTVLSTVDDEAVQVLAIPAESHLKGGVQVGDGAVTAHQQASPDQRADAAMDDAQLVNNEFGGRFWFRLPVMVRPATSPAPPTVFRLSKLAMG